MNNVEICDDKSSKTVHNKKGLPCNGIGLQSFRET